LAGFVIRKNKHIKNEDNNRNLYNSPRSPATIRLVQQQTPRAKTTDEAAFDETSEWYVWKTETVK
jgi:hypothetical protein